MRLRAKATTPNPEPTPQPNAAPPRSLRDALGVRIPFAPDASDDRRALMLAALALVALVAASGGFVGLAARYRRDLERA